MQLRVATAQEQHARDRVAHQAWGSGLTVEQFCEREAVLRAHPWAKRVMATWLWVDDGGTLASCETFRVGSRVAGVAGSSWSVASVLVEQQLRHRGHAGRMMRALVTHLSQQGQTQASVLFSEVGTALYERVGYLPIPSWDVFFPAEPTLGPAAPAVAELPEPPELKDAPETLVLVPTAAEADWHIERERFYARVVGRPPLRAHGATLDGSSIGWTAYYRSNELHVLWLTTIDPAHRAPLLSAAQATAKEAGLAKVRVWETDSLADLPTASRVPRDGAVAMFAPLCPGLTAWTQVHRVVWV